MCFRRTTIPFHFLTPSTPLVPCCLASADPASVFAVGGLSWVDGVSCLLMKMDRGFCLEGTLLPTQEAKCRKP